MAIGTAGYTAMLCVLALERHGVQAGRRPGARHRRDRRRRQRRGRAAGAARPLASPPRPGKPQEADYLRALGAGEIIDRAELGAPGKPLQKERWAAVVDAVGSHTLANALAQTRYGGVVAACGLAQGYDLPGDGDAVHPARRDARRHRQRDGAAAAPPGGVAAAGGDLDPAALDPITEEIALDDAIDKAGALLAGGVRGRVVVRI